jgi:hypothetical protein
MVAADVNCADGYDFGFGDIHMITLVYCKTYEKMAEQSKMPKMSNSLLLPR